TAVRSSLRATHGRHCHFAPSGFDLRQPASTPIYTLSLHDALPIFPVEVLRGEKVIEVRPHGVNKGLIVEKARAALPEGALLVARSEEHTSELQSRENLVCRLLLQKKNLHSSATRHATLHTHDDRLA